MLGLLAVPKTLQIKEKILTWINWCDPLDPLPNNPCGFCILKLFRMRLFCLQLEASCLQFEASCLQLEASCLQWSFLLTVDNFSFFTYNWSFFAYSFSFLTHNWSFFAYNGKVHLIRALRDCKQRSLTVSKKAPTVSQEAIFSPLTMEPPDLPFHAFSILGQGSMRPVCSPLRLELKDSWRHTHTNTNTSCQDRLLTHEHKGTQGECLSHAHIHIHQKSQKTRQSTIQEINGVRSWISPPPLMAWKHCKTSILGAVIVSERGFHLGGMFRRSASLAIPHLKSFAVIPSVSLVQLTNRNVFLSHEPQCEIALIKALSRPIPYCQQGEMGERHGHVFRKVCVFDVSRVIGIARFESVSESQPNRAIQCD